MVQDRRFDYGGGLRLLLVGLGRQSGPKPIHETPHGWLNSLARDGTRYYGVSDVWDKEIRQACTKLGR
jgi:hypothetical protein